MPAKKKPTTEKKKKKGETMSLAAFQQSVTEEEGGSWGDRMADDVQIPTAITTEELREATGDSGYRGRGGYRHPRRDYEHSDGLEAKESQTTTFEEYMSQPKEKREPRPRHADNQPLPTERPFVVYIGNLPFQDVSKADIADFFGSDKIEHIVLPIDRERGEGKIKGHGYVEFLDLESYKEALLKHNTEFRGRQIRVDVTDPETAQRMCASNKFSGDRERKGFGREHGHFREDRPKSISDEDGNWRGGGRTTTSDISPFPNKNKDRGGSRGDREDRGGFRGDREERSTFGDKFSDRGERHPFEDRRGGRGGFNFGRNKREQQHYEDKLQEPEPVERPKINLKPRTSEEPLNVPTSRSDIFGGGKAWEETEEVRKKMEALEMQEKKQLQEAEKRLEEEKKKRQEEREKQREEKLSSDKPQKKSIDFSTFGKNSSKGRGRGSAIPSDETGKKDYKKRYENKEKREDADTKKEVKKKEDVVENRFGVLGEEDLE